MPTKLKRFTMDLSLDEYKKLNIAASVLGITKKKLILNTLNEFLQKKINKITEKTFKATDQGKFLNKFNSLDEMFESLGI